MKKIKFVSLGCDKNLVDSEVMLGIISRGGYEICDDEEEADVIIINTCCFIEDALQESIDTIIEMGQTDAKIIVTGCMAERYKEQIYNEIPEVDVLVGAKSYDRIIEAIEGTTSIFDSKDYEPSDSANTERIVSTPGGHFAYLKIAEGCDKNCTYCIIPSIRGKYKSRQMASIVDEARSIVKNGVKEIIVVAQDTTYYGMDTENPDETNLVALIRQISEIEGLEWIRLLYTYPEHITDELINEIATNDKVCKYLDMPIQHSSDNILKRMGRRSTTQSLKDIIAKLRRQVPDITLRTTLITGFPGEGEAEFEQMQDFVSQMKFDRLGVFAYSREEDTPAYDFPEQVDEDVKQERKMHLLELQKSISQVKCDAMIGKKLRVIVDGMLPDEKIYVTRSYSDTPDVDGLIFVKVDEESYEECMAGDFIDVEIISAQDYDLIGVRV